MLNKISCEDSEDEISLKDIIRFFTESWKVIGLTTILGIICASVYLMLVPYQYEATAQIKLAKISSNNNNYSPGIEVEEVNEFLARLRSPTTYSIEEIKACGVDSSGSSAKDLVKAVKFSVAKNTSSIVELKISRGTKEEAKACAYALFEMIKATQNQIIESYVDKSKVLLVGYEKTLSKSQNLGFGNLNEINAVLATMNLVDLFEVKHIAEEIFRLKTFINQAYTRPAELVVPIYVSDEPVFPKNITTLIIGFIAGIFLGIIFVISKKSLKSLGLLSQNMKI